MMRISEVRAAVALTSEHLLDVGKVAGALTDVLCRLQLPPNCHVVTDMEVVPAAAMLVSDGSQIGIVSVPEILTKEGHIVCHGDGLSVVRDVRVVVDHARPICPHGRGRRKREAVLLQRLLIFPRSAEFAWIVGTDCMW